MKCSEIWSYYWKRYANNQYRMYVTVSDNMAPFLKEWFENLHIDLEEHNFCRLKQILTCFIGLILWSLFK
jgi:hypothetical protein